MIPTIGVMVGSYIIARMLDLVGREGDLKAHWFVKFVAIVVMIVNALGIFVLLVGSSSSTATLGR